MTAPTLRVAAQEMLYQFDVLRQTDGWNTRADAYFDPGTGGDWVGPRMLKPADALRASLARDDERERAVALVVGAAQSASEFLMDGTPDDCKSPSEMTTQALLDAALEAARKAGLVGS